VSRSLIDISKRGTKRTLVWILWSGLYWDLFRTFCGHIRFVYISVAESW